MNDTDCPSAGMAANRERSWSGSETGANAACQRDEFDHAKVLSSTGFSLSGFDFLHTHNSNANRLKACPLGGPCHDDFDGWERCCRSLGELQSSVMCGAS